MVISGHLSGIKYPIIFLMRTGLLHPQWTIDIHTKVYSNLARSCWDICAKKRGRQTWDSDQQLNPYLCDHQRLLPSQLLGIQQLTSSLQCCKCIYSSREEGMRWLLDQGRKTNFGCRLLPGGGCWGLRWLHQIETQKQHLLPWFLFSSSAVAGKKWLSRSVGEWNQSRGRFWDFYQCNRRHWASAH